MDLAEPNATDYEGWVARLADPLRASRAYWHLVLSGADARSATIRGLSSTSTETRRYCAMALDHLSDEASFPMLVELFDDDDPSVRVAAVHALACDRCKTGACLPTAALVLTKAIGLLTNDDDAHVRAAAVELVGRFVHTNESAERAVVSAVVSDRSPAVRKKARGFAPGGTVHAKTRPRPARARHRAAG